MIHQPSGGTQGMASDIAIHAEEIIKLRHRFCHNYRIEHRSILFTSLLQTKQIVFLAHREINCQD